MAMVWERRCAMGHLPLPFTFNPDALTSRTRRRPDPRGNHRDAEPSGPRPGHRLPHHHAGRGVGRPPARARLLHDARRREGAARVGARARARVAIPAPSAGRAAAAAPRTGAPVLLRREHRAARPYRADPQRDSGGARARSRKPGRAREPDPRWTRRRRDPLPPPRATRASSKTPSMMTEKTQTSARPMRPARRPSSAGFATKSCSGSVSC